MIHGVIAGQVTEAISVDIVEAATAVDATATGNVFFATLVDDPANALDNFYAYVGAPPPPEEVMLEAASAADTVTAALTYTAAIVEEAVATEVTVGAMAPPAITAAVDEAATASSTQDATAVSAPTRSAMLPRAMIGPSAAREATILGGSMVNIM